MTDASPRLASPQLVSLTFALFSACVNQGEAPATRSARQRTLVEGRRDPGAERPATLSPSPVAALLDPIIRRTARGGTAVHGMDVLREATEDELRAYFARQRELARGRGATVDVSTREDGPRAATPAQRSALAALQGDAAGELRVVWDPARGAPASVENLAFFRGRLDARAVWEAFLGEHFERLSVLWGVTEPEQLEVTEAVPLGAAGTTVLLRGARKLQGVPVHGQSFEVHVTTDASPLGAGVLTRLDANFDGRASRLPATPRSVWLSREAAISAVQSEEPPRGATLGFLCGEACTPYWRVEFATGRVVTLNALTGAVEGDDNTRNSIGPVQLRVWRPGDTSAQPVAFRNANVVDSAGNSLGNTSFSNGTHNFTTSATVSIGLEGATGSSNPDAHRRVFRERLVGSTWTATPLRRNWTPSTEPARDFGSPDAWAPNSDPSGITFPHTTELLYGVLSYWTYLFNDIKVETTGRLSFRIDSGAAIRCSNAYAGDIGTPPDPDGNTT